VQVLIRRTSGLLSPEKQAAFGKTMENFAVLTGTLAQRSDDINMLITNSATTMDNVREMSLALKDLSTTLSASAQQLTQNANDALVSFGGASASLRDAVQDNRPEIDALIDQLGNTGDALARTGNQLEAMVAENRGPVRDFTQEGLYQLTDLIVEARDVLDNLKRVTSEVQRDPARFLFGNQQQGYEAGGDNGR
jgi:phospholipid/cholesterol/gamma-HCH transport system substrate-binding protein